MEVTPGYKQTEVGVIPEDWGVYALSEIGDFKNGLNKDSAAFGHGSPFVNLMDVFGVNSISTTEQLGLVACSSFERASYNLRRGDVIFVRSSVKPSGVGLTAVIESDLPETVYSGFLIRFRDRGFIDVGYKKYCFYEGKFRRAVIGSSSVSANTNISQDSLKRLTIPLPPTTTEQEAIAEALSDADALIESLEQLIVKKRHLKQGAMQELLTGKNRLPGFEVTPGHKQTDVGVIPEDWIQTSIREIAAKVGSGVTPTGGSKRYKEHGRPFVRSQNVGWGSLLLDDMAFIDEETHNGFPATELKKDDVLLNITGASIGRTALADRRLVGGNVNQHVCIIRSDVNKAVPKLINLLLLSALGQRQIESFQAGGNRQGLNFSQIESIKLPLPPTKAEQGAVASVLSDMDAEIAALETKLAKARQLKQGMMQELLTGRIRLV
jgi:type I restriction enzyme S subunit